MKLQITPQRTKQPLDLEALMARAREKVQVLKAPEALKSPKTQALTVIRETLEPSETPPEDSLIVLNEAQTTFTSLAASRANCVLVGAAGTGKTTCMNATIQALIASNIRTLQGTHKTLKPDLPAIICCAFTNRAVNNLALNIPADLRANCLTIHKLLEFAPFYFEVEDEESGKIKKTMEFIPSRNSSKPLDPSIEVIILEEASMVSEELFQLLMDAIQHPVQIILLGDIQQLPTVFGLGILGFKMLEWEVIELTHVYRQALESPIIRLAHRILSGVPILQKELQRDYENKVGNDLRVIHWAKPLIAEAACIEAFKFMRSCYDAGQYVPEEHTILIPYNKVFGTLDFNLLLANHIARKNLRTTYEVVVGFSSKFLSIGDYILQDKREATIVSIEPNPSYTGKEYKLESETLDYWGHDPEAQATDTSKFSNINIDVFLDSMTDSDIERTLQVSHYITVQYQDSEEVRRLSTITEIQGIIFAYAITVHKSQGSEWEKVFLLLHKSHATMLQRELLYTAVTRAKKELVIICEKDTFLKGIVSQKIKGDTLAEKLDFFQAKKEGRVQLPKFKN